MRNITLNSDVARVSSCLEKSGNNFFKQWLEFIRPVHKLSSKEIDILSSFLRIRYELSKSIHDENLLDSILMSVETKRQVREEHGLTPSYFQVTMTKFKKRGVLVNGRINKLYVPNVEIDSEGYKLIILFDFSK